MSAFDKIPDYLLEKFQLTATVVFAALFSLVFLLVHIPFSDSVWFELALTDAFAVTVAFFLISVAVVAVSKRLMALTRGKINLTVLQYVCWNFAEVVVIAALYTLFTVEGSRLGFFTLDDTGNDYIFFNALLYLAVSLGVPYLVAALYFAINDKNNTIRLLNYGNVVSDEEPVPFKEKKITLADNNGLIKLSVSLANLLFIESDDNYIKVWYRANSGELKQYMLRCKLKTIEESFAGSGLMRCHRKYIVNMSQVSLMTRDKNGYVLDLDEAGVDPIPVSKTYEESVLAKFNSR